MEQPATTAAGGGLGEAAAAELLDEMLESLEAIQDTLEKLTDLSPKSLECSDG